MNPISLKRINQILLFSVLLCIVLYYSRKVLIPVTFAAFLAMLFAPLATWMEHRGIRRVITTIMSVLITIAVAAGIVLLVFWQGKSLVEKLPVMKQRATEMVVKTKAFVNERFGMNEQKQEQLVDKQLKSASQSSGSILKKGFVSFTDFITASVLVLLFLFLFLYQREKYEAFFLKLCTDMPVEEADAMLKRICRVSQQYLRGRIISIGIFTACFTIGFLIVGLENAFFLAFVASVLTIIPYVGSLIGGLIPFAVALVTSGGMSTALGALAVVAIVQGIDNYFIEPYLIGGGVSISGFFTILILVVGSALWGIAGMILFIPILGVVKIICDSFPDLAAYGFLIGDQKEAKASPQLKKLLKNRFRIQFGN